MMRLRHIVQSVLCCLLCLTVCASPAYANLSETITYVNGGFFYPSAIAPFYFKNSSQQEVSIFNGNFSASFKNDDWNGAQWVFQSDSVGNNITSLFSVQDSYLEILFNVKSPVHFSVSYSGNSQEGSLNVGYRSTSSSASSLYPPHLKSVQFISDNNYYPCVVDDAWFQIPDGDYRTARYFGYRFVFNSQKWTFASVNDAIFELRLYDNTPFSPSDWVNGDIVTSIDVNTGILQEISGNVTDIKTQLTQLSGDVSEIKNGLQDSNSSIWQSFKDSVSGLFVPSSADLEGVKDGFDQLAQDKLGGAYQSFDTVIDGVQTVNNKFKNPGSSPGVEFPGISVPLGGDVGTVTLAASQTVTIPEKIANVLYPVAGVIIPIVCVIWTIRQCTDMVECFMSGMSYAEFLHRNSDREDDEV